jgi:hypothetical protein
VSTGAIGAGQKKTDALLELIDVSVLESDYGGNNPSKDRGVIKVRVPSFLLRSFLSATCPLSPGTDDLQPSPPKQQQQEDEEEPEESELEAKEEQEGSA